MRSHLLVVVLLGACGDNKPPPLVAKPQELALLAPLFDTPFNHGSEVTLAAHHGRVVVASANLALVSTDTFEIPADKKFRKIAVNVSNDGGRWYGPAIDPTSASDAATRETGDPVIRVAADGTFFLTVLDIGFKTYVGGIVARSTDGTTWTGLYSPKLEDKPWLAIDDANQQLFVAGVGGYWRLSFDGTLLQETLANAESVAQFADAYVVGGHARFATLGSSAAPAEAGEAGETFETGEYGEYGEAFRFPMDRGLYARDAKMAAAVWFCARSSQVS